MQKRKESLSALKVCRFCLSQNQSLGSLYDRRLSPKTSVDLSLKILSCVSIEVFPSDKMPAYICSYCKFFMDLFYKFKQIVRQADENILKYIQNGTPLESLSWPSSLVKAYESSVVRHEVMKVEGGATVQVTTHDVSCSEDEEEENVYNVTIADNSDDGSKSISTCIKVVSSKDDKDSTQSLHPAGKGFTSHNKMTRQVAPHTHGGERPYQCKHCDKIFTKSQQYMRHLRLKHRETLRTSRGSYGQQETYRCDQCDDSFSTQDQLIYHSAIHATQNLTCPLCQEKFNNVDAVTTHIKSHVNGVEFMCDFCELVFTTKDKLEGHIIMAHEDEFNNELGQDESSMEMDAREEEEDDDDNDNNINVKDEGDHMLIEIKKADEYMLHSTQEDMDEKYENTNSEESEPEVTYTELSTVDTLGIVKKGRSPSRISAEKPMVASSLIDAIIMHNQYEQTQSANKPEEAKRKHIQTQSVDIEKKEKSTKADSNNSVGASNKSLQLLEKELQELKRTNTRNEANKTSKTIEPVRNRRIQIHSSTPKAKPVEEKKMVTVTKTPPVEKRTQERRLITKENKEPRESKEIKVNTSTKEDKEVKDRSATPTPKSIVKNGNNDKNEKSSADEGIRRSTRPSKVKDYAKMIRDRADDEDSDDADDEEYKADRTPERTRGRKSVTKVQPKMIQTTIATTTQSKIGLAAAVATPTPRKRGRPRKEPPKEVPAKVKKETSDAADDVNLTKTDTEDSIPDEKVDFDSKANNSPENSSDAAKVVNTEPAPTPNLLVSPSGQTLKKVPIKALPPGVRPLPLPVTPRLAAGELCEMQIGKKMVKVQKIVMTKAEVEAMAKKGLVEMKDGTMVLKQGIKLPKADPVSIKSTLVGDADVMKETITKKEKGAPSRCDLGDDA